MNPTINLIMLVDDNEADNFLHTRTLKRAAVAEKIIAMSDPLEAMNYLKTNDPEHPRPELIFLDINMPKMNGWEFLEEFNKLEKREPITRIVVMLSASINPEDAKRANALTKGGFRSKPLTSDMAKETVAAFYANNS